MMSRGIIEGISPMRMTSVLAASLLLAGGALAQSLTGAGADIRDACKSAGGSDGRCLCMGTAFDPDSQGDALADRAALLALWKAGIASPGFPSGSPPFDIAAAKSAVEGSGNSLSDRLLQIYVKAFGEISAACRPL